MSTALDVTSYNEALKALCKEEKVKYVDTTDLTDASYYGEDGSTMTKAYYEACINKILEAAFRNYEQYSLHGEPRSIWSFWHFLYCLIMPWEFRWKAICEEEGVRSSYLQEAY